MKKTSCCLAVCWLALVATVYAGNLPGMRNPADISESTTVWVEAGGFAASTFRPLQNALQDHWDQFNPRDGNNVELLLARTSLGWNYQSWAIETGVRQQAIGQANTDTLDVYRAQQLNLALPASRSYGIDYALEGLEARYLALGRAFQWGLADHAVHFGLQAALLDAWHYKEQKAWGQATVNANTVVVNGSTYNDDSAIDTAASGFIPRFQNQTPTGQGYALDLGMRYVHPQGFELAWSVADALGEIQWNDVPEITLSGNSTYNGQFPGGHKVLINRLQTLLPRHSLRASLPLGGDITVEGNAQTLGPLALWGVGVKKRLAGNWELSCDYDFYLQTLGLGLSHPWLEVSLSTDSLQAAKVHALMFRLLARLPL